MSSEYAIYFDLDNTLIHRAESIALYAKKFFGDFHLEEQEVSVAAISSAIVSADCGGYLPENTPYSSVKESVIAALRNILRNSATITTEELERHWVTQFPACSVEMPGARELVWSLEASGFYMGVVSNGADASRKKSVESLSFGRSFRQVLSSEHAKAKKPDPAIFRMAAKMANISVNSSYFIGDHPVNDLLGALESGMQGIWLKGFHSWPDQIAPPKYTVDSLREVVPLIQAHSRTRS
ncbi:MAG: putative hydrolase of the HAD superfamily [Bacteroidia bacterium]|jgi:putative hydrolase of the HAD superfamily